MLLVLLLEEAPVGPTVEAGLAVTLEGRADTASVSSVTIVDEQLHRNMLEQRNYWKNVLSRYVATILFPVREAWLFAIVMKLMAPETTVIIWAP